MAASDPLADETGRGARREKRRDPGRGASARRRYYSEDREGRGSFSSRRAKAPPADAPPTTKRSPVRGYTPSRGRVNMATQRSMRALSPSGLAGLHGTAKSYVSSPHANPEKALAAELIISIAVYAGIELFHGSVPSGKRVAGLLGMFGVLSIISLFGDEAGRVAYLFGALVMLTAIVLPLGESLAPSTTANIKDGVSAAIKSAVQLSGAGG